MTEVCKKCGGTVKMDDQFCMHCGMPLEKTKPVEEDFVKAEPTFNPRAEEEKPSKEKAEVLSMWEYLLMLIVFAIPVVNVIIGIVWIVSGNGNPNRRNFAKAWMITAVVSAILSGLLAFGLFQFFVMDHYVDYEQHIEYSIPEEEFINNFLTEMDKA